MDLSSSSVAILNKYILISLEISFERKQCVSPSVDPDYLYDNYGTFNNVDVLKVHSENGNTYMTII